MNFNTSRPGLKARALHLLLAAASAAALLTSGVAVVTAMPAQAAIARDVAQALKLRLPKTPIDALDCTTFAPWCEVVSGESLFYIDEAARYLFVGRLYDLEERRDVTAARLLELNPDLLAAGAARAAGARGSAFSRSSNRAREDQGGPLRPAQGWRGRLGQPQGAAARRLLRFPVRLLPAADGRARKGRRAGRGAPDLDLRRFEPPHVRRRALRQGQGKGASRCLCRGARLRSRPIARLARRSMPTKPSRVPMALPGPP